jgi:hypothetical protein
MDDGSVVSVANWAHYGNLAHGRAINVAAGVKHVRAELYGAPRFENGTQSTLDTNRYQCPLPPKSNRQPFRDRKLRSKKTRQADQTTRAKNYTSSAGYGLAFIPTVDAARSYQLVDLKTFGRLGVLRSTPFAFSVREFGDLSSNFGAGSSLTKEKSYLFLRTRSPSFNQLQFI